jgi:hypothetical protein
VGANATSSNQITGNLEEFITRPTYIRLAEANSAAGLNSSFVVGRTMLKNDQSVSAVAAAIILPDHVALEHGVNKGRMVLTARNTTAGALTYSWLLDVIPLR